MVVVLMSEWPRIQLPEDTVNISFSSDEKYCVYLYNNEIFIKDIAADTITNKISDNTHITNFIIMIIQKYFKKR